MRLLKKEFIFILMVFGQFASAPGHSLDHRRQRQPASAPRCFNPKQPRMCLACNAYYEARGESFLGQVAVSRVVLTRAQRPGYPKSICGVVYQPHQFSWTDEYHGRYQNAAAWARALRAADTALQQGGNGYDHFHATYVRPRWARICRFKKRIGTHIFYSCPLKSNYAYKRRPKRLRATYGQQRYLGVR